MINRVILVGNLTRDAEATSGPATTLTRMRLATNVVWRDGDGNRQESAEFHNVVAFGKLAEICGSYCVKGRRVYVEGRLRTREYDGSDGVHRYTTEVVAESLKFLDRAPQGGEKSPAGPPQLADEPTGPCDEVEQAQDVDAAGEPVASGRRRAQKLLTAAS